MTKQKGPALRPQPLSALSAVERYLKRAERERRIRHVLGRAGTGPIQIGSVLREIVAQIRMDRGAVKKQKGE